MDFIRLSQDLLETPSPAVCPSRFKTFEWNRCNESDGFILFLQLFYKFSGPDVYAISHSRDEVRKTFFNGFQDLLFQFIPDLFLGPVQLIFPMAGKTTSLFSRIILVHAHHPSGYSCSQDLLKIPSAFSTQRILSKSIVFLSTWIVLFTSASTPQQIPVIV